MQRIRSGTSARTFALSGPIVRLAGRDNHERIDGARGAGHRLRRAFVRS